MFGEILFVILGDDAHQHRLTGAQDAMAEQELSKCERVAVPASARLFFVGPQPFGWYVVEFAVLAVDVRPDVSLDKARLFGSDRTVNFDDVGPHSIFVDYIKIQTDPLRVVDFAVEV